MLAYHILIPVLFAAGVNGFYGKSTSKKMSYLPPGYIIGMIWTFLLALLGYVHFLLYRLNNQSNYGSVSVVLFILFSLTYPVINAQSEIYGYMMNLVSLILSFTVGIIVMMYSKHTFLYMIPLLVWVSYVNLIVLNDMLSEKDKI